VGQVANMMMFGPHRRHMLLPSLEKVASIIKKAC
jgi:hypothetical protein